jgi:hypothetical protein
MRLLLCRYAIFFHCNAEQQRPHMLLTFRDQAVVLDAMMRIDLSAKGSPSLVMKDLSEYATLSFLAAFDLQPAPSTTVNPPAKAAPKRVTYIALSKKAMPKLVDLYLQFKDKLEIYVDGTLESVLSVRVLLNNFSRYHPEQFFSSRPIPFRSS